MAFSMRAVALAGLLLALLPRLLSEVSAQTAIPFSDSFELTGRIEQPARLRLVDLQAKPATVLRVFYSTSAGPVTATFNGVLLWTLLQRR